MGSEVEGPRGDAACPGGDIPPTDGLLGEQGAAARSSVGEAPLPFTLAVGSPVACAAAAVATAAAEQGPVVKVAVGFVGACWAAANTTVIGEGSDWMEPEPRTRVLGEEGTGRHDDIGSCKWKGLPTVAAAAAPKYFVGLITTVLGDETCWPEVKHILETTCAGDASGWHNADTDFVAPIAAAVGDPVCKAAQLKETSSPLCVCFACGVSSNCRGAGTGRGLLGEP